MEGDLFMSLVSNVMNTNLWLNRTSDAEFELGKVGEELRQSAEQATMLGDALSRCDESRSRAIGDLSNLRAMKFNPGIMQSGQGGQLDQQIAQLEQHLNQLQTTKTQIRGQERVAHQKEKTLQTKKNKVQLDVKMSQAMVPAFEKMADAAIKRMAPKV